MEGALAASMVHRGHVFWCRCHVCGRHSTGGDAHQRSETETSGETSADTCGKNCANATQISVVRLVVIAALFHLLNISF